MFQFSVKIYRYYAHQIMLLIFFKEHADKNETSNMVQISTDMIQDSASLMKVSTYEKGKKYNDVVKQPAWWCSDLDKAKHVKQSYLREFRITNVIADLTNYKKSKKDFKALCSNKKQKYRSQIKEDIIDSLKDPTSFWTKVKKHTKLKNTNSNKYNTC